MSMGCDVETDDPPTIVFRDAVSGGVTWEWTPPLALWLDMLAFAAVTERSIEALINDALTEWLRKEGELEGGVRPVK